ncbi:MAG: 2,3-bisphosphoglycerate-independent phosphoglycerate mutase [Candidatus Gastranaerophilales bacterium]|nr:2,3-bisphosphoglycerate-independent phosphoglycerate mutase [Candidatus Gastranaerophilales bacterium]
MFETGIVGNNFSQKTYPIQKNNSIQNSRYSYQKIFSTGDRFSSNEKAISYNNSFISFGRKVVLAILDGWGNGKENDPGNTLDLVKPETFNEIMATCPNTNLYAHGEHVGLPEGQMGNSEVGHTHIGGGRVVSQDLTRIDKSIKDGDFFENAELLKAMQHAKENNSALHLMGLVSTGGVHSSLNHLLSIIDMAKQQGVEKVYVHAFLDGRDTPPQSAVGFVNKVEEKLKENGYPPVASVMGRIYAMDRDKDWSKIETAYNCLLSGTGSKADSAIEGIEQSYKNKINDEFVEPTVIGDKNSRIKDKDSVIFFNFRADRAREITDAMTKSNKDFSGFERKTVPQNLNYTCMTSYFEKTDLPVAFKPQSAENFLSEVLSKSGKKQFKVAETQKFDHITNFFNNGRKTPFPGEIQQLIKSDEGITFDEKPEMKAKEITEEVKNALRSNDYEFVLVNYANPDMVGHTGKIDAAKKAVTTVDNCLKDLVKTAKEEDATIILTADHGNIEQMIDHTTNEPHTAHTTNMVPLAIINAKDPDIKLKKSGSLVDVAPTVLDLMEIKKPEEMTGESLIVK